MRVEEEEVRWRSGSKRKLGKEAKEEEEVLVAVEVPELFAGSVGRIMIVVKHLRKGIEGGAGNR